MFGNPLKNPLVIKTILDRAQQELNKSLRYRKEQFAQSDLYMWVELDKSEQIPYISLMPPQGAALVRMTTFELLEDEAIQLQLKQIPKFVRRAINFENMALKINNKLQTILGEEQALKILEGNSQARIQRWANGTLQEDNLQLRQLFA